MRHRRFIHRSFVFVGCILLLLVGVTITCNQIVRKSTKDRVFNKIDSIKPAEVGLLLGTTPQTRIGGRKNMFFQYRINATEELYKAGKIKYILISGDENSLDGINEPECMKDSLMAHGIPENVIFLDGKGFRTLDAVVRATKVYGLNSYVVISQKFHNERAIFLAEHMGLNVQNLSGFNAADAKSKMAMMTYIREYFARVKVFVDIVTGKEPLSMEKTDCTEAID